MKRLILFVIFGMWHLGPSSACSSTWTRTIGGPENDCGYSICTTHDSGYALTGYTESYGAGMTDMWLIKTDSTGVTIWDKTFGGPDSDGAYSIAGTPDDGYLLAGYTRSFGAGGSDVWLVKVDMNGDTVWTRTYGDTCNEYAYSLVQAFDSGYIAVGTRNSCEDAWIIRLSPDGDTLWTRTLERYGHARCVRRTEDSSYILAGYADSLEFGGSDGWLMKLDISGDTLWSRAFGRAGNEDLYSVAQKQNGGYVMVGMTDVGGYDKMWLVQTDSLGSPTFDDIIYCFHGRGHCVVEVEDGRFVIAGSAGYYWADNHDAVILSPDLWWPECGTCEIFGGKRVDGAHSFEQISDSAYVMVGFTESYGEGERDLWLMRTKGSTWDWYGHGTEEPCSERKTVLSVSPNPAAFFARITFHYDGNEEVDIALFDITGRRMAISVDSQVSKEKNAVILNTRELASGKYFLRMQAGDMTVIRGMVVAR